MAKQCMTVVDTDRLQSVAEALRCRHDDGSDGGTWRVKIGPRNARFFSSTDFLGGLRSSGRLTTLFRLCCESSGAIYRSIETD